MFVYSCNTQNNIFYNSVMHNYQVIKPYKVANDDLRLRLWKQHHDTSSQAGSVRNDVLSSALFIHYK